MDESLKHYVQWKEPGTKNKHYMSLFIGHSRKDKSAL